MKKCLLVIVLILNIQGLTSCQSDDSDDSKDPTSSKGFALGRAIDVQGKPLPGVEIILDNTYLYDSNLIGVTDENGEYKIELGFGTYLAYAKLKKTFNGKEYIIDLHPDNDAGFSQEGAVRNFSWKTTGKKPGTSSGYYGGSVEINKDINSQIYDTENIEFTLRPVGNLIDGSAGEIIVMKPGQPSSESYGKLLDLPIGRYEMSAVYKNDSGDVPIKLKNFQTQNEDYVLNLLFDFEPQTNSCFNCINILYKE